jgi:hypothetical protein
MNHKFLTLKTIILSIIGLNLASTLPSQAIMITGTVEGKFRTDSSFTPLTLDIFSSPPEILNFKALPFNTANPDQNKNPKVLEEKQNTKLSQDILVWDGYNYPTNKQFTISSGTTVSSTFMYFNPPGDQDIFGNSIPKYLWSGILEFDSDIIGIVARDFSLTNQLLGLNDTTYQFSGTLDGTGTIATQLEDYVSFEGNKLSFLIGARWGYEPIRIITAAEVPEPMTILGSLVALCFGGIFKKHSQKA